LARVACTRIGWLRSGKDFFLKQLISYIAPGAPATRREAAGNEAFLRPEIGFTPAWYRQHADIDFGERFHTDPAYRRDCVLRMRGILSERFPGTSIGGSDRPDAPLDLLTGTYGACTVAAIYGIPVLYDSGNWPNCVHNYLADGQLARLEPPDLERNPHFEQLLAQLDWIAREEGCVEGFINWQGVLNNAHRLRGEQLFVDMLVEPEKARHLFACVAETMIQGIRRLHEFQRSSGVDHRFVTVSNCLVNMVSPETYRELLLPLDRTIATVYDCIAIHNCAWNATPYLEAYAEVPGVGYIDMGIDSDLVRARELFPAARRALMYTPMDLAGKTENELNRDIERVAIEYAPCDFIVADIEAGVPDSRVHALLERSQRVSGAMSMLPGQTTVP
jgi:hypothetical protein